MRIERLGWALCAALLLGLWGCAAPVVVDGYKLGQSAWSRDAGVLRGRASFDLACRPQDVTLRVLAADNFPRAFGLSEVGVAKTVGADGCGNRATYTRLGIYEQWFLNGASTRASNARPSVSTSN